MTSWYRYSPRASISSFLILAIMSLPSNQVMADGRMTLKDLSRGVHVWTLCEESQTALPSGASLNTGCYDLIAHITQKDIAGDGSPIFDANVEFREFSTRQVVAVVESNGFVTEESNRTDISVTLDGQTTTGDLFSHRTAIDPITGAAREIIVRAEDVENCTSNCLRKACGICSTNYPNTIWGQVERVCHGPGSAGQCVSDGYAKCWYAQCDLVKGMFDFSIAVTGLGGVGGVAGRAERFLFGATGLLRPDMRRQSVDHR